MFFNLIKQINRLREEIDRLVSNIFNSVKKINSLRKEKNRLLSKGMSNISWVQKICYQVSFGELQLPHMIEF